MMLGLLFWDELLRLQAAKSVGVPVILDALIPVDLLNNVDIFSPNKSELARLTGMPTENI
ncbi:hypothetical protein CTI12_AA590870 [Artemisia annua]|uniref:Carbohydrate kinase PfkB domain-containing protein n=1 Tax=Artemisia annua TaxID=35608 RepID=A0A2U1KDN4_ARTAN|nr:hypothetical protein CTI12_AA590870 [Artemisia annua]